jgi:hypothetical protein
LGPAGRRPGSAKLTKALGRLPPTHNRRSNLGAGLPRVTAASTPSPSERSKKTSSRTQKLLTIGIRTLRITDTPFNYDRAGVYDDLLGLLKLR